jgi:hypothetical protein
MVGGMVSGWLAGKELLLDLDDTAELGALRERSMSWAVIGTEDEAVATSRDAWGGFGFGSGLSGSVLVGLNTGLVGLTTLPSLQRERTDVPHTPLSNCEQT